MSTCWKCNGLKMPVQDAQRLALCPLHLQQRIRSLMGLKP